MIEKIIKIFYLSHFIALIFSIALLIHAVANFSLRLELKKDIESFSFYF